MFEKLLQKIIQDVVGEFIDGIDLKKLNIGIWSGTVDIFNVSLKPKILAMFGLPYKLIYSNIKQLRITIPWKNLFSAPLIIEVDSVQIIVSNQACILTQQQKITMLLLKLKQYIQKISQQIAKTIQIASSKDKDKNPSYLETVSAKMIDNLYLTIRNIHLRFQFSTKQDNCFAFGATLETLELYAVNDKGQKQFIDRSKIQGESELYKKLSIANLGIYWNFRQNRQYFYRYFQSKIQIKNYLEQGKALKKNQSLSLSQLKVLQEYRNMINLPNKQKNSFNFILLFNIQGKIKQHTFANNQINNILRNAEFQTKPLKLCINQQIVQQIFKLKNSLDQTLLTQKQRQYQITQQTQIKPQMIDLLRKYCRNQLKPENDTSKKYVITLQQKKKLEKLLFSYQRNYDIVLEKVKEIIFVDIGQKGTFTKSQMIQSWCKVESIITKQTQNLQGTTSLLKIILNIPQISLFYLQETSQPIIEFSIKNIKVMGIYETNKYQQISLSINKLSCQGFRGTQLLIGGYRDRFQQQNSKMMHFLELKYMMKSQKVNIDANFGFMTIFYDIRIMDQINKLVYKVKRSPKQSIESNKSITIKNNQIQINLQFDEVNMIVNVTKYQLWTFQIMQTKLIQNTNQLVLQTKSSVIFNQKQVLQKITMKVLYKYGSYMSQKSLKSQSSNNAQKSDVLTVLTDKQQIIVSISNINFVLDPTMIKSAQNLIYCLKAPKRKDLMYYMNNVQSQPLYSQVLIDVHKNQQKQNWDTFDCFIYDRSLYIFKKGQQVPLKTIQQIISCSCSKKGKMKTLQIQFMENNKVNKIVLHIQGQYTLGITENAVNQIIKDKQSIKADRKQQDQLVIKNEGQRHQLIITIFIQQISICVLQNIDNNAQKQVIQIIMNKIRLSMIWEKIELDIDKILLRLKQEKVLQIGDQTNRPLLIYNRQQNNIHINMNNIQLNYFPLKILYINKYAKNMIKDYINQNNQLRIETIKQSNSLETTTLQIQNISCKLQFIQINMFNILYQNQNIQSKFTIDKIQTNIQLFRTPSQISLQFLNLQLFWIENNQSYKLISSLQQHHNYVSLIYLFPTTTSTDTLSIITRYLAITNYHQQQFIRFTDYILCQVKDTLLVPHQFNQYINDYFDGVISKNIKSNSENIKIKSRNENHQLYLKQQISSQQLIKLCENKLPGLNYMKIDIILHNSVITFEGSQIQGKCDKIIIKNSAMKEINQPITTMRQRNDLYICEFIGFKLLSVGQNKQIKILDRQLDFIIKIDLFMKSSQYNVMYPQKQLDNSMFICLSNKQSLEMSLQQILCQISEIDQIINKYITSCDNQKQSKYSYDAWLRQQLNLADNGSNLNINIRLKKPSLNYKRDRIDQQFLRLECPYIDLSYSSQKKITKNVLKLNISNISCNLVNKPNNQTLLRIDNMNKIINQQLLLLQYVTTEQSENIQIIIDQQIQIQFKNKLFKYMESLLNINTHHQNQKQSSDNNKTVTKQISVLINQFKIKIIYQLTSLNKQLCLQTYLQYHQNNAYRQLIIKQTDIYLGSITSCKKLQEINKKQKQNRKNIIQLKNIIYTQNSIQKEQVLFRKIQTGIDSAIIRISIEQLSIISNIIKQISSITKQISKDKETITKISSKVQQNQIKAHIDKIETLLFTENMSRSMLLPLVYSKFQIFLPQVITNTEKQLIVQIVLLVNYYNQRINCWEPIVQETALKLIMDQKICIQKMQKMLTSSKNQVQQFSQNQHRKKSQITQRSDITYKHSKQTPKSIEYPSYINVNITTNFLQAIANAFRKNQQFGFSHRMISEIQIDEVNSWVIINELGYSIKCQNFAYDTQEIMNKQEKIQIQNGAAKQIYKCKNLLQPVQVINQSDSLISVDQVNQMPMKIDLVIDDRLRIKNLQIGSSQIGLKKLIIEVQNRSYFIYRHIYSDISKNVRYIKFYSGVMLSNLTNIKVWLHLPTLNGQLFGQQKQYWKKNQFVLIQPNKQIFLPIIYDRLTLVQGEQLLSKILTKNDPQSLQTNNSGDSFLVVRQTKRLRTIFKIYPKIKITNKLPETLGIALKVQDKILSNFMLTSDSFEYLYSQMNQDMEISFYVDGYQWTQFQCINQISNISLKNYAGNCIKIKLTLWEQEGGITCIIVYPIAIFHNICDFPIQIQQFQQKNNVQIPPIQIKVNQEVSLAHDKFLIFKPKNGQLYQRTSLVGVAEVQQFLFNIHSQQTQTYQYIVLHQKFFKNSRGSRTVNIKYVSVASKFIFHNNTQFQILFKKYAQSNKNMRIINPKSVIPLRFLPSDFRSIKIKSLNSNIQENSLYQIAIKDSEYEWSGALSIMKIGNTFAVLRSRSHYKTRLVFVCLSIVKYNYMNRYKIQLNAQQSITQNGPRKVLSQAPYIIRNKLIGFDIWIPQYAQQRISPGQKLCFSWDQPILKANKINIVIAQSMPLGSKYRDLRDAVSRKKIAKSEYIIDPQKPESSPLILPSGKRSSFLFSQNNSLAQINCHHLTQKCCLLQFKPHIKTDTISQQVLQINLPFCISLINNSFTPSYHLCDISVNLNLSSSKMLNKNRSSLRSSIIVPLKDQQDIDVAQIRQNYVHEISFKKLQIDNHLKDKIYFPVVLSTEFSVKLLTKQNTFENLQVQANLQKVFLNIEEEFALEAYAYFTYLSRVFNADEHFQQQNKRYNPSFQEIQEKLFKQKQIQAIDNSTLLISKLRLPKLIIKLQVKTTKLSIQTTINLQQPEITRYPWVKFPYPISNIIINLLSNLSISPLAVISSFKKGVSALLTQQESARGFEGFFGQTIGAVSNAVTGIIGIVVGYDIQMVDNFFDGIDQGTDMFFKQIVEIKDCFEPQQCTPPAILKGLGKGIIGMVFKPVKGLLQMTLKISEGMKKTALYSFESQKFYRKRNTIVFYGPQERIYPYSSSESQYKSILMKSSGGNFQYFHIIKFIPLNNIEQNIFDLLAIGNQKIVLIDMISKKQKFIINLDSITQINMVNKTKIQLVPSCQIIQTPTPKVAEQICHILKKNRQKMYVET